MPRYFSTLPRDISDERFFRRLELMRLQHLRRAAGWSGGEHRARRIGGATEFAGHRAYNPGDDLRYLDWHLLARLDRPYVKTFHEEEYYHVHIILDASRSMQGVQQGLKLECARDAATALSYLILANDDRLHLACLPGARGKVFESSGARFLTGKNQITSARSFLAQVASPGSASFFAADFAQYVHHHRRRLGLAVIVSDFLAPLEPVETALFHFVSANCRLAVIRIIDDQERTFAADRSLVKVIDMETGNERLVTLNEPNRISYEAAFASHREGLQSLCKSHGIAYAEIDTTESLYDSMPAKLAALNLLRARRGVG